MAQWDEHTIIQSFINDVVASSKNPAVNNELVAFLMGVAQHEVLDLVVNERPVNMQRIDFEHIDRMKSEAPTLFFNVVGIGVSLWRTLKRYSEEKDKEKLRVRLAGLLGAVTPDLLEGIRLVLLPDGRQTWQDGNANFFHIKEDGWKFPIDTFNNNKKDLQRRMLLQGLTVSMELFKIEF